MRIPYFVFSGLAVLQIVSSVSAWATEPALAAASMTVQQAMVALSGTYEELPESQCPVRKLRLTAEFRQRGGQDFLYYVVVDDSKNDEIDSNFFKDPYYLGWKRRIEFGNNPPVIEVLDSNVKFSDSPFHDDDVIIRKKSARYELSADGQQLTLTFESSEGVEHRMAHSLGGVGERTRHQHPIACHYRKVAN